MATIDPPMPASTRGTPTPSALTEHGSPLVRPIIDRILRDSPDFQRHVRYPRSQQSLTDLLIATPQQGLSAGQAFDRLRWGGLFAYACEHARQAVEMARELGKAGFIVERGPESLRQGWRIPLLSHKTHFILARKVLLIPPGATTERFTYDVRLAPRPGGRGDEMVVLKEVPDAAGIVARLQPKFPLMDEKELERRARKFSDHIFPTFLTREAAFLMILQDHLPPAYRKRVPQAVKVEQDERGFVRKLWMNWLRNGGPRLSHMEFAHQSADLLRMLHDVARVIHLDLRLDNFVITDAGVGFVDFGSAVREGENLAANPLLATLFQELMHTSQIQRMLHEMTLSGHVTSDVLRFSQHKVDKAADFFYLAVQFNCPHANPDLVDFIQYEPDSADARRLARLTAEILRPADPSNPTYRSAKDILHAIERLQLGLDRSR